MDWSTQYIGEQLHTYITAGRALVRVLLHVFFCFNFFCVISLIIDSFNCMPFFPTHISNRINETACLFLFTSFFSSFLSTPLSIIHSFFLSFFLSVFLFAYRTERQTWLNLQLHRDRFNLRVSPCVCVRMKLTRHVCTHNCVKHTHTLKHIRICLFECVSVGLSFDWNSKQFDKLYNFFPISPTHWKFHFQIY